MIIGLHGRKREGKDTLAGLLCAHLGYARIAFADPLTQMLEVLPIPQMYKEDKNVVIPWIGKTYTELLQTLGTEWGRTLVKQDLWIHLAGQKAVSEKARAGCNGLVFSDVRYTDEADYVKAAGGIIIFMDGARGVVVNSHSSESGLPEKYRDYTVENNGTIDDLWASFKALNLT